MVYNVTVVEPNNQTAVFIIDWLPFVIILGWISFNLEWKGGLTTDFGLDKEHLYDG